MLGSVSSQQSRACAIVIIKNRLMQRDAHVASNLRDAADRRSLLVIIQEIRSMPDQEQLLKMYHYPRQNGIPDIISVPTAESGRGSRLQQSFAVASEGPSVSLLKSNVVLGSATLVLISRFWLGSAGVTCSCGFSYARTTLVPRLTLACDQEYSGASYPARRCGVKNTAFRWGYP